MNGSISTREIEFVDKSLLTKNFSWLLHLWVSTIKFFFEKRNINSIQSFSENWEARNILNLFLKAATLILKWKKGVTNNEDYQLITFTRLPRWHSGRESACQCRTWKRCPFNSRVGNSPWRKKRQSTPIFLPGEVHGQKSLVGDSPCGLKELDTTEHIHTAFIKIDANILNKILANWI